MRFQTHEHHLGTIGAPTRQCSVSVTSIAAEGGRRARGWVLVKRAVKISDIFASLKRQNGSHSEATTRAQEGRHQLSCEKRLITACYHIEKLFSIFFFFSLSLITV